MFLFGQLARYALVVFLAFNYLASQPPPPAISTRRCTDVASLVLVNMKYV